MDFFKNVHSVRLLGHKGKFLWADDDRRSVAQKKGQDSYGVIWRVELVPERNAIRLKSVYDLYLIASDYPFLLGATGKKVMQSFDTRAENVEWEPLRAGEFVKLRTKVGDKFLRANGGMPPYRNSVTHDVPVLTSNQHVVLWEVDVVRRKGPESPSPVAIPRQKQEPKPKPLVPPESPPPLSAQGSKTPEGSAQTAVYVPLSRPRRHSAPEDIEFPLPSASESSSSPFSEKFSPTASPPRRQRQPSPPPPLQPAPVENLPRRGQAPIFPNPDDQYDSPSPSPRAPSRQPRHRATVSEIPTHFSSRRDDDDDDGEGNGDGEDEVDSPSPRKPKMASLNVVNTSSPGYSPRVNSPSDYRRIFYTVAEDDGEVLAHDDDTFGSFLFMGHTLMQLTEALQLETGIDEDVVLCMRNPITSKLYKMRLQLPPNRAPLSVVIVRHNSRFGRTLSLPGSRRR